MPRCKNYLINVPKFYRFQSFDHIMFGYIHGLRKALPSMSVTAAVKQFLESFGIEEDEYCFDNAKQNYYRILESIVQMNKEQKNDKDDIII